MHNAKNAKHVNSDSVHDMQTAMAKAVDEELIEDIRQSNFFSIMLYESTDRSTEKTGMLYVSYMKCNENVTKFLSVVEHNGGNAECIFKAVQTLFECYELNFSLCIFTSNDGASVMTGIRSGVITRFSELNPFIIKTLYSPQVGPSCFSSSQFNSFFEEVSRCCHLGL